jgi:metal-responsive CopG/Arc/MetJ family transcriptional regulator
MKEKKKISIHFTIDKNLNEDFDKIVKKNCINKSLLIQTLIEKYLKDINSENFL